MKPKMKIYILHLSICIIHEFYWFEVIKTNLKEVSLEAEAEAPKKNQEALLLGSGSGSRSAILKNLEAEAEAEASNFSNFNNTVYNLSRQNH